MFKQRITAGTLGLAALIGGAVLVASCGGGTTVTDVTSGTLLTNVTVVDTRDGTLRNNVSVAIDNGKIQEIAAANSLRASGTALSVDGTGKFLVPGFLDMHTHSMATVDLQPSYMPLLIANGVTGIREMSGTPALIQRARQLNTDTAAGRVDAPEILGIPSLIFGGQSSTAAGAAQFVRDQKASGADFFKVTAGNRDAVLSVLAEAKIQGLDVAGHLVPAISALESSNLGWKSVEHLGAGWGLLLDCASDETAIRGAILGGQAASPPFPPTFTLSPRTYDGTINAPLYQRIMDTYNDAKCRGLAQTFAKNSTWQAPTLIRLRTQVYADDAQYRTDPNLIYVDKTTRALWEQVGSQSATLPTSAVNTLHQFYTLQKKVTKMMKQSGVKMLAGSDLGGIWVIPGVSLHQEFRELAAAGLTPLEVLQMTTLNGAQFLGREAAMGTVDIGKNADLVLLDANPIDDVANLDKIAAVVFKGKYLSKVALDKLKSDVAAAYAGQSIKHFSTALDPSHVD